MFVAHLRSFGQAAGLRRCSPFLWLAALALVGCSAIDAPSPRQSPGKALVRLSDDEAKGVDPQIYADLATARIASEQFEGLTRLNGAGQPEPGLAESWQVSADGLSWAFRLQPKLKFSDGTPITAQSFAAVFTRLRTAETASPHLGLFSAIESVSATSEAIVTVKLSRPVPALPELLAHPALAALPLHRARWANERPVVASGAYRLIHWKLSDHILLATNPNWHSGRPSIDSVIWRPVSDSLTAMRSFAGGEADVTADFPSSRLSELRRAMPLQVRIARYRGTYYFAFNTRRAPFSDVRVRQALSMMIDRDWITRSLIATGAAPAHSLVPPGLSQSAAPEPFWQSWPAKKRQKEAQSLLAAAGYGPQNPLRFSIRFNSDVDHRRIAVAMSAMWKPLHVKVDLLNSEASLHFASLKRADFDLARSGWIADYSAPENFLTVHTRAAGASNYSGYASPAYEETLAHAMSIANPAEREKAMRAAENVLINDAPILILWHYVSKSLVSTRVKGWQDNIANAHPSRTLSLKP